MPILKPIAGHGSVVGIRRYLEKKNRALAKDLFNLSWAERGNCNDPQEAKNLVRWDEEMDAMRASLGHDSPWKGKRARTFKHFVISPDPDDGIDLDSLRELACAWALEHFPDNQIAIVYHDDNEGSIPHAHVVVNSSNLATGNRMQTEHPEDLNRALQDMARERGLTGLSNVMPEKSQKSTEPKTARTRQGIYFLPLIIVLPRMLGMTGVEITQTVSDAFSFATSLPFLYYFLRRLKDQERFVR